MPGLRSESPSASGAVRPCLRRPLPFTGGFVLSRGGASLDWWALRIARKAVGGASCTQRVLQSNPSHLIQGPMAKVTPDQVLQALRQVKDPDLHQDIVSLGFVKKNTVEDGVVEVTINLTTPACPVKDELKAQAAAVIRQIPGVRDVKVEMTAQVASQAPPRELATGVKHFLAVSSGKGGVGKSTVAVNLAVALAQTGARVGLLDCDVYGPDVPMMMGLTGSPEQVGRKLVPKERHGVKTMSIGYLLEEDKPVVWRGPMV